MFILEVSLDLKSRQGNITTAFLHTNLNPGEKVFIKMPMGFKNKEKVLKLKATLYALPQYPGAIWQYLTEKMQECGMSQTQLDHCLFVVVT